MISFVDFGSTLDSEPFFDDPAGRKNDSRMIKLIELMCHSHRCWGPLRWIAGDGLANETVGWRVDAADPAPGIPPAEVPLC